MFIKKKEAKQLRVGANEKYEQMFISKQNKKLWGDQFLAEMRFRHPPENMLHTLEKKLILILI